MTIYHGDCLTEMANISDNSVDLVFTSPPYAQRRKSAYGGIDPIKYLEWFKPIRKMLPEKALMEGKD